MGSIDDVDAIRVTGVWYRHTRPDHTTPYWYGHQRRSGRWQRNDVVRGIYLAASEDTAWREWYRLLAEDGIPPKDAVPRALWRVTVDLPDIANLSTAARLRRAGLNAPLRPARGDWPDYQDAGHALWRAGHTGVLAPSAAGGSGKPGKSLCIFWPDETVVPGIVDYELVRVVDDPPPPPRGLRT